MDSSRLRLYLVADPELVDGDLVEVVASAIDGGATCVQLRAKSGTDCGLEEMAHRLSEVCRARSALFLVNDRVDVALAVGADGVHLGVDDLSVEAARRLGGERLVVGYSPETDDQTRAARARGVDYLGVGPVFGTASKADAGEAIGLHALARRVEIGGLPTVGIGGITGGNAAGVIGTGAVGVAVMSAVLRSPDPRTAAERLRATLTPATR